MDPYRASEGPPEADRSILVVGIKGYVLGVDRTSGETVWQNELPGGGTDDVFVALRYGVLAVSANSDAIYRLDYLTGQTLWTARTRGGGRATILVEPDLIVVGKGGYINAYSHAGRPLWVQELRGRGLGEIALAFPGNVAQADNAGTR